MKYRKVGYHFNTPGGIGIIENRQKVIDLFGEIKKIAQENNSIYLRIDPDFENENIIINVVKLSTMFDVFDLNRKLVSELREIAKSLNIEKIELMKNGIVSKTFYPNNQYFQFSFKDLLSESLICSGK